MSEASWIARFETPDGPLLVEADFRSTEDATKDLPTPADLVETIKRLVAAIQAGLADHMPTETTVEVGLKLAGETGHIPAWVIGKSTGEATLGLTLTWKKP